MNISENFSAGSISLNSDSFGFETKEFQKSNGYQVMRRNGDVTEFDPSKIEIAISKAFVATHQTESSQADKEKISLLTKDVTNTVIRRNSAGTPINIEDIQDQVELALMRSGEQLVARNFVLYREKHAQIRREKENQLKEELNTQILVVDNDGNSKPLDVMQLQKIIEDSCQNLTGVDATEVIKETVRNLYHNIPVDEVNKATIMAARSKVEVEPNYTFVCARLLLNNLQNKVLQTVYKREFQVANQQMRQYYPKYFEDYIKLAVDNNLLDKRLLNDFDLPALAQAIKPERDLQFNFLGLQTLYDRYFLHKNEARIELPQSFFMRVSMGLAINESDKTARAVEFYNVLSQFDFMSSTPTLFNSGTLRPQLSSCYISTVADDLDNIFDVIKDNALLSKFAGGLGNDWTSVRSMGAHIKGTNGKSQGVVPFLKVANDTALAVNQGGKRKGALCSYLETWHLDIEEFLELRKNTGDDRRRTHDMNTANWVPDLFMKRVAHEENWTLFSPADVPDLHDLYGKDFEQQYVHYEKQAKKGLIAHKTVSAIDLWRKMLAMIFETGHPWITFKDPCNIRSPQNHYGVVHSSNLCTEITLNTSRDEVAVCNLGSVNLVNHLTKENKLDIAKIEQTVKTAMRMLDNVIDYNYYSVDKAAHSNKLHRPVGLGIMGFHDSLYRLSIPYASDKAIEFADRSMEAISYFAIQSSCELAQERGKYETFEGSLWSRGILPIDSIKKLEEERQGLLKQNTDSFLDWDSLRSKVVQFGMRNSNTMAIAPTATIANITGVSQSIEPTYQNLYSKSNLSGDFTVVNQYLVDELRKIGLWDDAMINDLKYYNGSIEPIERIPQKIKNVFATAFEIEPGWLIEAASRRQKWIDQSQSLNLYIAKPDGKKLDSMYKMAWVKGLKTTYYLRSLAATNLEKSTLEKDGNLSSVTLQSTGTDKQEDSNIMAQASAPVGSTYGENNNEALGGHQKVAFCDLFDENCEACQ